MSKLISIFEWNADTFYMFHEELIQHIQLKLGYSSQVFSLNKTDKYDDVLNLNASAGILKWISGLVRQTDYQIVFMVKAILLHQFLSIFFWWNRAKKVFIIEGKGNLYNSNKLIIRVLRKYFEFRLKSASVVIVLNQSDFEYFSKFCKNIHLINGIGLPSKYYETQNNTKVREFRYGFVGRKIKDKGIQEFVTLTTYSDKKHIMVGENEGRDKKVNELIDAWSECPKNLNIDFVADMMPYYDKIDFLVFPSTYNEGYPRVLMEAMSRGVIPIIIYKQKFDMDFIHTSNCLFYDSFDAETIINDVNVLCSDTNDIIKLRANCEDFALKTFSIQSIAKVFLKVMG